MAYTLSCVSFMFVARKKHVFRTGRRPSLAGPPLGVRSSHLGCRRILQPGATGQMDLMKIG